MIILYLRHIFLLKTERTILQISKTIIKKLINHPGIQYLIIGYEFLTVLLRFLLLPAELTIVCIQPDFNTIEQLLDNCRISTDRNPLISVREIIVVIGKSQRNPLNDKCR